MSLGTITFRNFDTSFLDNSFRKVVLQSEFLTDKESQLFFQTNMVLKKKQAAMGCELVSKLVRLPRVLRAVAL